jgi:hypothetical protein
MTYYNIEIQMAGERELTDEILDTVMYILCAKYSATDEVEDHRAVIFYRTQFLPSEMREKVWKILNTIRDSKTHEPLLHYIDVEYRYEWEMTPDRFVCWSDGRLVEYKGHVIYTEEEE